MKSALSAKVPCAKGRLAILMIAAACFLPVSLPCQAGGGPLGASVVSGSVAIASTDSNVTHIAQSSDRAVVDWQSFSIPSQARVEIAQPSRDSILVNRVRGETASVLAGTLRANGNVVLINPNGITVSSGATIHAAAFAASTDLLDDDGGLVNMDAIARVLDDARGPSANEAAPGVLGPRARRGPLIELPTLESYGGAVSVRRRTPSASGANVPSEAGNVRLPARAQATLTPIDGASAEARSPKPPSRPDTPAMPAVRALPATSYKTFRPVLPATPPPLKFSPRSSPVQTPRVLRPFSLLTVHVPGNSPSPSRASTPSPLETEGFASPRFSPRRITAMRLHSRPGTPSVLSTGRRSGFMPTIPEDAGHHESIVPVPVRASAESALPPPVRMRQSTSPHEIAAAAVAPIPDLPFTTFAPSPPTLGARMRAALFGCLPCRSSSEQINPEIAQRASFTTFHAESENADR